MSDQVCKGSIGPIALKTRVGWILSGPVEELKSEESVASTHTTQALQVNAFSESEGLEAGLKWFWDLEAIKVI